MNKSINPVRWLWKGLLFFSLTFIFSCNLIDSLPTEDMALKKIKEDEFNDETTNLIDIIEFQKTNGIKANVFGVEKYSFEYLLTVKFKQNAHGTSNDDLKDFKTDKDLDKQIYSRISADGGNYQLYYNQYKHFKKDDTMYIRSSIILEKTENGWR